jgi:hypothetical protein
MFSSRSASLAGIHAPGADDAGLARSLPTSSILGGLWGRADSFRAGFPTTGPIPGGALDSPRHGGCCRRNVGVSGGCRYRRFALRPAPVPGFQNGRV